MKPSFNTILKWSGFPVDEAKVIFKEALAADKTLWQTEKMWEIFKFHYQNNQFYRGFAGKEFADWSEIPVIRRKDLKGDYMLKTPAEVNTQKLYSSSTSGSSGDPLFFARDPLTHALVWENVRNLYEKAGVSLDDRQARMFGISKKQPDRAKARLKDRLSNRYRFDVFDLSDSALDLWVKQFRAQRFKYIYGYTNSLVVFAQYLIRRNQTLKSAAPLLKCCIITSEVCTANAAQTLRKGLGIPVFNEYGSSELGIMGFKESDCWQASDELLYLEVLDENDKLLPDGEIGRLTCTALFNRATPFIRYQLGDLAAIRRTADGHTQILEIMGSLNDLAILPSGRKVPGISFYFVAQSVVEASHNIREFLFRQTSDGFTFEYVSDTPVNDSDFRKIKKDIILYLKEDIKLSAIRTDELQRGKNGKFKHFIYSA
ncbi:MAG: hypothetical protein LBV41_03595 [Cytophagaceae bacterium]|jgi:phenylacetate-CoA ligase|nr:hypothetical protein [Cytophagaceae bacterium]